jgi:hypothetical protein
VRFKGAKGWTVGIRARGEAVMDKLLPAAERGIMITCLLVDDGSMWG